MIRRHALAAVLLALAAAGIIREALTVATPANVRKLADALDGWSG